MRAVWWRDQFAAVVFRTIHMRERQDTGHEWPVVKPTEMAAVPMPRRGDFREAATPNRQSSPWSISRREPRRGPDLAQTGLEERVSHGRDGNAQCGGSFDQRNTFQQAFVMATAAPPARRLYARVPVFPIP